MNETLAAVVNAAPMKISVLVSELQAAMLFSSTDESRFVLNSVLIQSGADGPLVVATDGRRLVVIESQSVQENLELSYRFAIRTDFLKPLLAFAKTQGATLVIEPHPPTRCVFEFLEGHCAVDAEEGALVEGDFPNWKDVIPSGEREPFNNLGVSSEYMTDFYKAGKLLQCEVPILQLTFFQRKSAMAVRIDGKPQFYGVLMPCMTDIDEKQPEFLFK